MRFLLSTICLFALGLRTALAIAQAEIPAGSPVIITEFLAGAHDSLGLRDEDGELQEWVEIFNRSSAAVDLAGWTLTDDANQTNKWIFPSRILGANEYLVVFASAKDRTNGAALHTNFKLSRCGEFLGLFDAAGSPMTRFAPKYPEQRADISYGLTGTNFSYMGARTPGSANGTEAGYAGVVDAPHYSVQSGFFQTGFGLSLNCETAGALIRYTLDGSEPAANSQLYTGAIAIASSPAKGVITVRAAGFKTGYLSSQTITHTYIFPQQVLNQPVLPAGFPATWDTLGGVSVPADYEMDPQVITNVAYTAPALAALTRIPSLSVVLDAGDLFGQQAGIYANPDPPRNERAAWERAASVELINPDGRQGFSTDAGLRIQGGSSRDPNRTHKHSFRLFFRGDYGDAELDHALFPDSPVKTFNTLVLDAGLNLTWTHRTDLSQRMRAQYVRDQFVSDVQQAMGYPAAGGKFVHLYLNGLYWGLYNIHERPDEDFAASHYGGEPEQFDVIKNTEMFEVVSGDSAAWNSMMALANAGLANNSQYEQIQQYLDVPAFIDYMLANLYAGNDDWPFHNWYAIRKRDGTGRFRFVCWDSEHTLKDASYNALGVNQANSPGQLFAFLKNNAEFRLLFSDHVREHFFNSGLFYVNPASPAVDPAHPENNRPAALYMRRIAEIDPAIVLESARWGDNAPGRENQPFTRDVDWLNELNFLKNTYFPQRSSNVLNQFRAGNLYPSTPWVDTPSFNQHGGQIPDNFQLTMASAKGTIYYTTNGSDPRVYGSGAVSADARVYTGPVTLGSSCLVQARAQNGTTWSAINSAAFEVARIAPPLRITEIMYNPAGGSAYEFIEMQNTGSVPLDLGRCSFEGIAFTFSAGFTIAPGALIVLASSANPTAFAARYPGVAVAGYFNDSLSNGGERIALIDPAGRTLAAVTYDDENGWPPEADGGGSSLELIHVTSNPNDPANWRASVANGTPGVAVTVTPASAVQINELMAENAGSVTQAGAHPDWFELFNSGTTPVNLSGWSCTDDSNPRKYLFPSQTTIAAGGYLVVWCDTNAGGGLHSGFSLDRDGETVSLYDAAGRRVDAVSFGYQLADRSVGRISGQWELTSPTPGAVNAVSSLGPVTSLSINEWLANAPAGSDDWVEIHNRSDLPVSAGGQFLCTSNDVHLIRDLTFIPAHGYLRFIADNGPGPQHLDFKLSAAGDALILYSSSAVELDRVTFGVQTENVSEGRWPDGSGTIIPFPGSSSPGTTNYVSTYAGPRLNEIMARNTTVRDSQGRIANWIELYNPAGVAFSMSGMSLSFGRLEPGEWTFPAGASISAGGFLVLWCDPSRAGSTTVGPDMNSGLALGDQSGGVYLFDGARRLVDSVEYGQQVDRSIGKAGGTWQLLETPTLGTGNSGAAALAGPSNLRFNEWMAATDGDADWFEIYNGADRPVNLAGLHLTDDPSITGQSKFQVAPLSYVGARSWVVWLADDDEKNGRNHVNFNLDGQGESLRLYDTNFSLVCAVDFGPQQSSVAEGCFPDGGTTVMRFPLGASPGAANRASSLTPPVILASPTNTTVVAGNFAAFSVSVTGPNLVCQWWCGTGRVAGGTNAALVLPRVLPEQAGNYWLTISNSAGTASSIPASLTVMDADSDGDGLPNSWELRFGLDPFSAADGVRDSDGDGMSNAMEFYCGTDPNSAASSLGLQATADCATGGTMLRFVAMPDRAYSIQCKDSFAGTWADLTSIAAASQQRTIEWKDLHASVPQRFYRVVCMGPVSP